MKSEIIRKNPAFRGTPPAFGRSRSDTILVFLMKNKNLCDKKQNPPAATGGFTFDLMDRIRRPGTILEPFYWFIM